MAEEDAYTKEIEQRINALPADIRELVYSADMNAVIQKIGAKNQLHVDQMGALESEVAAIMIGMTPAEEFVQNLMDTLEIPREKADAVMQDVNDMLFLKIRESMKQVQVGEGVSVSATTPTPPIPTQIPQNAPETHPADVILTQKTISMPPDAPPATTPAASNTPINPSSTPPAAPKPPPYKTDPYREPPE